MAAAVLHPSPHVNGHFLNPSQTIPPSIRSNKGVVSGSQLGWLRESPADAPIEDLRQRLDDDGYVFVKGLLPRDDVLKMREHYFSQFEGTKFLLPGARHVDGIYNTGEDASLHNGIGGGEPQNEELEKLVAAHKTVPYLEFVKHPQLRRMVRDLMGWDEEVLLTRTMLRHNVPGGQSTGVHYDKLFLRAGDAHFLTAWVPIGDIRFDGGGLLYLEDSVRLGQAIEDDFNERAKDFPLEEKLSAFNRQMASDGFLADHPARFESDYSSIATTAAAGKYNDKPHKWLMSNYEAGDVVFHHECSIHTACGNDDPEGRIRLSTDLRFYDKKDCDKDAHDVRWMNKFWTPGDGL